MREPLSQFLPPSPRGPSLPRFATKGEEVLRTSGGQFLQDKKGKTTKRNPETHSPIPKRGLLLLLLRRFFPEILQSYDIVSGKVFVEFQASFPRLRDTGNSVHIHVHRDYRKRAWNKKEICIPDLTPSSHNKSEHGQIKYSKSGATNFLSAETGVGSWKHVFASLFPMQKRRKDH